MTRVRNWVRAPSCSPVPLAAIAALLALAGCGLGLGSAPKDVRLEVTRDFGARALLLRRAPGVRGHETVMSLLMRNSSVETGEEGGFPRSDGGGFVRGINGLSGVREGGDPASWFYYVNGVEAGKGAAETQVHAGDRVWWDHHDWSQARATPAVVGSFPQPFLSGLEGKRLPVRVECARLSSGACRTVVARLSALRVPAALAAPSGSGAPQTLRVLVGTFASLSADGSAHQLEQGPRASGVYVRFGPGGSSLALLDAGGHARVTLSAGAGLVAATRRAQDAPVWLITGTDEQGVARAAQALQEGSLHDRFALALSATGGVGLPVAGG
jgi:hypothetical protein